MEILKRIAMAALIAAVTWTSSSGQEGIRLPDIGDSSGVVVSQQDEDAYGDALMRELRRLAQMVEDPLVVDYVNHLGYSLVAFSDEPERSFNFFLIDDDSVNAFAAPGGNIGIHSELLLTAENESEVAAVLAHEIAHVTQRHLARAVESAQKMSLPMTLLMLGAVLAGAGNGDAVQTAVVGTQALMQQMQINFTRANEYEADRVGINTLAKAGYDPDGMASFFGKMQQISRTYGLEIPEFLRTHPVEATRIAEAKNRAAQATVAPDKKRDPAAFLMMRERVRVLTADHPNDAVAYYRKVGSGERHLAYGLALAQQRAGDLVGAAETLRLPVISGSDSLPVAILNARLAFRSSGEAEAFEDLRQAYPRNRAIAIAYAEELLKDDTSDPKLAEEMLRPLLARHTKDAVLFRTYARAADAAGEPVRASEAYAHYVFLQGRVYDAVSQLRGLLKTGGLDYYQRSRIEARLAEMEPILAEIERRNGYDPSEGKGESRRRG
ncbi:MAG: M48 family metalloprotease [Xanthomonadales bacterium]|nr:M48 family metalloprotease [Xanthomonadales bacterium]